MAKFEEFLTHFTSIRCPHLTEVCRNRSAHPRGDVIYLRNAEGVYVTMPAIRATAIRMLTLQLVQTFNGCGYCKVRPVGYHLKH